MKMTLAVHLFARSSKLGVQSINEPDDGALSSNHCRCIQPHLFSPINTRQSIVLASAVYHTQTALCVITSGSELASSSGLKGVFPLQLQY